MPKEIFEIKHFQSGTITTPDAKDIPDDAAVYSANLDSVVENGKLKSIPKDMKLFEFSQVSMTTGSGLDDIVLEKKRTIFADSNSSFTIAVKIISQTQQNGSVDKYAYSSNGGSFSASSLLPTTAATADTIAYGVKIYFGQANAHTVDDVWTITLSSSPISTTPIKMRTINNAGTNDLILYDSADNKLKKITDIYGSGHGVLTDLGAVTSSGNKVSMQGHNKELHIGTGGKGVSADNENVPKWVGYPSHGQWGDDPPSDIIIEDAELKPPSAIPIVHKSVLIGDYMYAIEWQARKVYKYKHTDNTFVETGGAFIQATAICQYDSDHILVFDQSAGTNGTVFKLTTDGLLNISSHPLYAEYRDDTDTDIFSDMHITDLGGNDEILWFSVYRSQGNFSTSQIQSKILFNGPVPTGSGSSITLTNRTWEMESSGAMADAGDIGNYNSGAEINTYRVCLSDAIDSDAVSMILDSNNKTIWTTYDGNYTGQTDSTGRTSIIIVKKDLTDSTDDAKILNTNDSDVKLFVLSKYNSTSDYEDRVVTSIHYTNFRYYVGYHGGTAAADGLFVVYNHYAVASSWSFFIISSSTNEIPQLNVGTNSFEWTNDNGSPTYAFRNVADVSGESVLTFRGFSTKNIGQLMTISFNLTTSVIPNETIEVTNDVSLLSVANDKAGKIGVEDTTTYQKYKIAYVYDSYQESQLSAEVANVEIDGENYAIDLEILVKTSNLSKRISHISLYRVQTTSSNPAGFYRLVKSIKFDGNWLDNDGTTGAGNTIGAHKSYSYSDTGKLLTSYDARNGISETMENFTPHYGLSTQLNSSMIIGDCWHVELDDAEQFILKSKIHRFDTYDWTADFLKLPNIPTAIAGFKGRLYAFDSNTMWRINTNGMYVEDTFEGIGCLGPDSIKVTEFGMCFLDKNNIYLHNGQSPIAIGTNIQGYANWPSGTDYSWYNVDFNTYIPKILFDSKRTSFVILFKSKNSNDYFAWTYNLPRKRWDMWDVDGQPTSIMNGEDGRMFLSTNNTIIDYVSSDSLYRNWEYVSKIHTFGYDTLDKKIYEIKTIGDDIGIEHYGNTSATDVSTLEIPLSDRRQKSIQLKLTGTTVDECDSVSIIYRRMPLTSGNI